MIFSARKSALSSRVLTLTELDIDLLMSSHFVEFVASGGELLGTTSFGDTLIYFRTNSTCRRHGKSSEHISQRCFSRSGCEGILIQVRNSFAKALTRNQTEAAIYLQTIYTSIIYMYLAWFTRNVFCIILKWVKRIPLLLFTHDVTKCKKIKGAADKNVTCKQGLN